MRCPYCKEDDDKVVDSRPCEDGDVIRRRRECNKCGRRYTSHERAPLLVVKKDGSYEEFSRNKVRTGIEIACRKRPVSAEQIDRIVGNVEREAFAFEQEVKSEFLGQKVMMELKRVDQVAYVRFASVYHDFGDISEFKKVTEEFSKGGRGAPD